MVSKMISGVAREELKDCEFSLDDWVNGSSLFVLILCPMFYLPEILLPVLAMELQ